ncbi:DUF1269 domain-containing protein [Chloroflexi bacterium TSY]|nr:DUF1269 domain-containing protein [Chloroflexi bacterium TSY]
MLASTVFQKDIDRASKVYASLKQMSDNKLVKLEAAAVVIRGYDGEPKLRETTEWSTGSGAGWGAFWGTVVGLAFAGPFAGLLAGAGLGALLGGSAEKAIDPDFLRDVGKAMDPGDSAVFMVIPEGDQHTLDEVSKFGGVLLTSDLTPEGQQALHKAVEHAELATAAQHVADHEYLKTAEAVEEATVTA